MSRAPGRVQLPKLHEEQRRIAVSFPENKRVILRCGRRFGKTTLFERTGAKRAFKGQKVGWFGPNYKLNSPTYNRLCRMLAPVIEHKSKIDQLIELKTGGLIEFWTLNDEDAGRSRFYDLVILDEASLVSGLRDIWEQSIAPTLLDRRGDAIMAGTPKGIDSENYFYNACTDKSLGWLEFHAPTARNPMLDAEAVAKLIDEYPPLVYQQEYLAEFVDWRGVAFFSLDSLLRDNQPVDVTWRGDQVFAVVDTASKTDAQHDSTGVVYYLKSRFTGVPLVILDWDVTKIEASLLTNWIPVVNARLEELATELGARNGNIGLFIEDKDSGILLNQVIPRTGITSHAIDSKLTSVGKEGRAIAASPHVWRGKVKLSKLAHDKTKRHNEQVKNHLIDQVCGFRMGQEKKEYKGRRDLLDCFCYGVCIALGDVEGF
jgi:hypothetical protein